MIRHVVLWKFRENEEENVQRFLSGLGELPALIPQILHLETGRSLRPEGEYDAILIADFASIEDLEAYKKHPAHLRVSALCKSIRTARQAFDYER